MDINTLLTLLIWLLILGGVVYVLWWLIGVVGLPEPFNKIAKIIVAIVVAVVLLNMLIGSLPLIRIR